MKQFLHKGGNDQLNIQWKTTLFLMTLINHFILKCNNTYTFSYILYVEYT
jgi:hypothetical protein